MRRVFTISNRNCKGPVGGGGGVNYKIYRANCKYRLIPDMITVFRNSSYNIEDDYEWNGSSLPQNSNKFELLKRILVSTGIGSILFEKLRLIKWDRKLKQYNKKYAFTDNDIYIFHDIESAICMSKITKISNSVIIYHHQGSLYNERHEFSGINSELYRRYMYQLTKRAFNKVNTIGFPSAGAKECLLDYEVGLSGILRKKNIKIFYNGVKVINGEINGNYTRELDDILDKAEDNSYLKFVTVSTLNEAKAVQRIPAYLKKFKENGIKLRWFLIGNGLMEKELEQEIEKSGLNNNVFWIRHSVLHDYVLQLVQKTDFYIMMHKYSIFDYAILEGMSCGNIPLLTDVGGNKEVLQHQSGFIADNNAIDAICSMSPDELSDLKKKNQVIQRNYYSEVSSLNYYVEWIKNEI